jgi:hypothetical protein
MKVQKHCERFVKMYKKWSSSGPLIWLKCKDVDSTEEEKI